MASTAWTKHIPPGNKLEMCERQNVNRLGGPPPIRIVGVETNSNDKTGVETVSIKLNGGTKHTAPKFMGGSPEEAVRHI